MMTALNTALKSIIHGNNDVCCLCLEYFQGDFTRINDAVSLDINIQDDIVLEDILGSLFDEEMYNYISNFNSLCRKCAKLVINYYQFIQISKNNAKHIINIVNSMSNSFVNTANEIFSTKSLFALFNKQDLTSKHYYDIKPLSNPKSALKRLNYLHNVTKFKINNRDIENKTVVKAKATISHTNIMPYGKTNHSNHTYFKCKQCLKIFKTSKKLRNHFFMKHISKKFKCHDCTKSYTSARFLENHRNNSHCSVICNNCGKTFHSMRNLKIHELRHNLTLVCQDCGRVYKSKAAFQNHIKLNICGQISRADTSDAKFTCDYCSKKYTQKVSLRVHIQYEHGNYKAHICEWCGKKFWAQSRLTAHIVKHTNVKNYPCTVCGRKLVSKESLLYHTRTHTGEKPYRCSYCKAQFLSASRRSEHVKRHHLGGILECDICHCKFNSKLFLSRHKKSHMKLNEPFNITHSSKANIQKYKYTNENKITLM